jgi:nuclear-control-of-ATPase protein 2
MPSEFTNHFTRSLELASLRPGSPSPSPTTRLSTQRYPDQNAPQQTDDTLTSRRKEELHALLTSLNRDSIAPREVESHVDSLQKIIESDEISALETARDIELEALEHAIIGKLAVAIYSDALDIYLSQAAEVEAEAEWWGDIERSRTSVGLYFVQSMYFVFLVSLLTDTL